MDNSNDPWGDAAGSREESQLATSFRASPQASLGFLQRLWFPTATDESGSGERPRSRARGMLEARPQHASQMLKGERSFI